MANTQSFEEAMTELEEILEKITENNTTLDDSIKLYAKAAKLLETCNSKLKKSSIKIQEIDDKIKKIGADNDI